MNAIVNGPLKEWVKDRDGESGVKSPKIKEIINILKETKEKTIVFSMFTAALDLIAYGLDQEYPDEEVYVQIDGSTTGPERQELLDRFRNDPKIRILIIHYKVGSEGLNLTQAKVIIRVEEWWTDAVHRQGDARSWRVGQTSNVVVHRIFGKDTLEERIKKIYEGKNEMADNILQGASSSGATSSGPTKEMIGDILGGEEHMKDWWG